MTPEYRLRCYRMALALQARVAALKLSAEEIAERFVSFTNGEEHRFDALKLAVDRSDRRANLDTVLTAAQGFADFAKPARKPDPVRDDRVPAERVTKKVSRDKR